MSEMIQALKGALDYTQAYRGQTFVIKVGGEILDRPEIMDGLAEQIALLDSLSIKIVLVHGGGPQATRLSRRLDLKSELVAGRRVTSPEVLEVAKMVYAGKLNVDLLSALRARRVCALGLSGIDGFLVTATKRPPVEVRDDDGNLRMVDFGEVGDIEDVKIDVLDLLMNARQVPVIASLAADERGAALNVNADTMAEALATALDATKLIFLTNSPGLLRDSKDEQSLVTFAEPDDLIKLLESGAVGSGMRPKVEACLRAVRNGVRRTHIIDGRTEDSLLIELFTGAGAGTMIVGRKEADSYRQEELS